MASLSCGGTRRSSSVVMNRIGRGAMRSTTHSGLKPSVSSMNSSGTCVTAAGLSRRAAAPNSADWRSGSRTSLRSASLELPVSARLTRSAAARSSKSWYSSYKGWGDSDGAKTRLAPYSRVADVQAALTFMGAQPEVDAARLGIYGTSYGGATVVFVAAIDPRVKCVVSVVGIGDGARWMRSVRRPDEYHDLLERAAA